jgi:hypothetical protein
VTQFKDLPHFHEEIQRFSGGTEGNLDQMLDTVVVVPVEIHSRHFPFGSDSVIPDTNSSIEVR